MSVLDILLLVVLAVFAIRGFWRGFVRETMGLAALVGAGLAAALFASVGGAALVERDLVPPEVGTAAAGVGIFLVTYVGVNLVGVGVDRLARRLFLGPVLRVTGVLFALVKGGALLGLVLMVGQRVTPWVLTDERLAESQLARPLLDLTTQLLDRGGEWLSVTGEAA